MLKIIKSDESDGSTNRQVYAIWSPTTGEAGYDIDITFNDNNRQPAFTKAHMVEMQDLSEYGFKTDLQPKIVGTNQITSIPVSETPIFVVIDASYNYWIGTTTMDPNFYDVEPMCCNGVKLSYRSVNTTYNFPSSPRVYYAKKTDMQAAYPGLSDPELGRKFDIGLTMEITNSGGFPEITQIIKLHKEHAGVGSTIIN